MDRPEIPPPQPPFADTFAALNVLWFAARCLAYPHELLVRQPGTMGRNYPVPLIKVVGLFAVPLAFAGLLPPADPTEMSWFLVNWVLLVVAAALHHGKRRPGTGPVHSRDLGQSVGCPARDPDRWSEVLTGVLVAGLAGWVSPAAGVMYLVGLVASRLHLAVLAARDKREVERMRDARIEAARQAARMREWY